MTTSLFQPYSYDTSPGFPPSTTLFGYKEEGRCEKAPLPSLPLRTLGLILKPTRTITSTFSLSLSR